jgi:hypothetical protein
MHSHLRPARTSVAYDAYWHFAAERQEVFFRRLAGAPRPWTHDPILTKHKFTNAYRASDRTSQYLIRNVIYREDLPDSNREVFFRVLLFKLFNKIETWELLERDVGPIISAAYTFERYDRALTAALERGEAIYSGAYIMPSGRSAFGSERKHRNNLRLLERMVAERVYDRLADAPTMRHGFEILLAYPSLGDFLAYQFITDVNYSEITDFSEMEFVVPGPGAMDGIRKCFTDQGGLNGPEIIRLMAELQQAEFDRLGLKFRTLWGRRLQLIDCQNLFCEVDKYCRVRYPDLAGHSGRTRIKQRFTPTTTGLTYWYPPKWGLNGQIPRIDARQPPISF